MDDCERSVGASKLMLWNDLIHHQSLEKIMEPVFLFQELKDFKGRPTFEEIIRQTKICSKLLDFVVAKMTPIGLILPKAMVSYSVYTITDSGNDAFELPLQFW